MEETCGLAVARRVSGPGGCAHQDGLTEGVTAGGVKMLKCDLCGLQQFAAPTFPAGYDDEVDECEIDQPPARDVEYLPCDHSDGWREDINSFGQAVEICDSCGHQRIVGEQDRAKCLHSDGFREVVDNSGRIFEVCDDCGVKRPVGDGHVHIGWQCAHYDGFREANELGTICEVCDMCGFRQLVSDVQGMRTMTLTGVAEAIAEGTESHADDGALRSRRTLMGISPADQIRAGLQTCPRRQTCPCPGHIKQTDDQTLVGTASTTASSSSDASPGSSTSSSSATDKKVRILNAFASIGVDGAGGVDTARLARLFEQMHVKLDEKDLGRVRRACPAKDGSVDVQQFVQWLYAGEEDSP